MPLILAIEDDRHQASQLQAMVRTRLRAELVLAGSAEAALAALGTRVPDLVLTSAFLSPKDETALTDRLRALDAAAAHVQTLTIPVLDSPRQRSHAGRGVLSVLLGDRAQTDAAPEGCDPAVFAEQCAAYLDRAVRERASQPDVNEMLAPAVAPPIDLPSVDLQPHIDPPPSVELQPDREPWQPADLPPLEVVADDRRPLPDVEDDAAFDLDMSSLLDASVVDELSAAIEHVTGAQPVRNAEARSRTRVDTWSAVPLGNRRQWPQMDGYCAEINRPHPPPVAASARSAPKAAPRTGSDPKVRRRAVKRVPPAKPVQDEWGLFDPAQCGFAALLATFDEVTKLASPLPMDSPTAGSPDVSR